MAKKKSSRPPDANHEWEAVSNGGFVEFRPGPGGETKIVQISEGYAHAKNHFMEKIKELPWRQHLVNRVIQMLESRKDDMPMDVELQVLGLLAQIESPMARPSDIGKAMTNIGTILGSYKNPYSAEAPEEQGGDIVEFVETLPQGTKAQILEALTRGQGGGRSAAVPEAGEGVVPERRGGGDRGGSRDSEENGGGEGRDPGPGVDPVFGVPLRD